MKKKVKNQTNIIVKEGWTNEHSIDLFLQTGVAPILSETERLYYSNYTNVDYRESVSRKREILNPVFVRLTLERE